MAEPRGAKPRPLELRVDPTDNRRLANLCGPLDANLRQIEAACDVRISRRGETFSIEGAPAAARAARQALEHFHARADAPLGDWNTMVVSLRGDRVSVRLNDHTVITGARLPGLPPRHANSGVANQHLAGGHGPSAAA